MSQSLLRSGWMQRLGVAVAAVGLLVATAQPASASSWVAVSRGFSMEGARTHLTMDARVLDPARNSALDLHLWLGPYEAGDSLHVALGQQRGTAKSRSLSMGVVGDRVRLVKGTGCTRRDIGGEWLIACERGAFNWRTDRSYRMVVTRGGRSDRGRLWRVAVIDLKTGNATKLGAFRSAYDRLATRQNGPQINTTVDRCRDLGRMAARIQRPVGAGSTVGWKDAWRTWDSCDKVALRASLDHGAVKLVIDP